MSLFKPLQSNFDYDLEGSVQTAQPASVVTLDVTLVAFDTILQTATSIHGEEPALTMQVDQQRPAHAGQRIAEFGVAGPKDQILDVYNKRTECCVGGHRYDEMVGEWDNSPPDDILDTATCKSRSRDKVGQLDMIDL